MCVEKPRVQIFPPPKPSHVRLAATPLRALVITGALPLRLGFPLSPNEDSLAGWRWPRRAGGYGRQRGGLREARGAARRRLRTPQVGIR